MKWILVLAVLSGCARVTPYIRTPRPCQDEAIKIVWNQVYNRSDRPPDIWWVPIEAQTCKEPGMEPGIPGYVYKDGKLIPGCVSAHTWSGGTNLIWYGTWSRTPFAYALLRVYQERDGLLADATPFLPNGLLAQANARLAIAGLCTSQP